MARLDPHARREALVALGRRLFSDVPYDALSIDQIATEAGVSKGLLYHYFPGKREFYVATLVDIADELTEVMGSAGTDVGLALDRFLDFVEHNPVLYRGLMTSGIGADPEVRAVVGGVRAAAAGLLSGASGNHDPLRLAGAVGFVEAATLAWLEDRRVSRPVLREVLVDAFSRLLSPGVED